MRRIVIGAAVAAVLAFIELPANAAERTARPAGLLPPHEIITVAHSAGLTPVGRPIRRGTNYLLRATDEFGQDVQVIVDGRIGELISVTPVTHGPRRGLDPMWPSVYESGPPVYGSGAGAYRVPPSIVIEEDDEPPLYRAAPVAPPAVIVPQERDVVAPAPERTIVPPAPLFSFPRPPESVPVPAPEASLPEPEHDENALLPPPPPRFPQRPPPPAAKSAPKAAKPAVKSGAAKSDPSKKTVPANSGASPVARSESAPVAPQN